MLKTLLSPFLLLKILHFVAWFGATHYDSYHQLVLLWMLLCFFMFHKIFNGYFAIFTLALTCLLCLACLRSFTNCIFYVSHNLRSNIATFWCCWMFGWIIVDHHVIIVPIKFFMVNWRPIHNNWLLRASFCQKISLVTMSKIAWSSIIFLNFFL